MPDCGGAALAPLLRSCMATGSDRSEGNRPKTSLEKVLTAEHDLLARPLPRVRPVFHLQPVLYIIGILSVGQAGIMLVPAAVDLSVSNPGWQTFAAAALAAAFFGGTLIFAN